MSVIDEAGRIERVARALCKVDSLDPDQEVSLDPNQVSPTHGTGVAANFQGPQWKMYLKKS